MAKSTTTHEPNYGDVALNLKPDWDRAEESNQEYALLNVGHENGVADAYVTDAPGERHQFAWVDPRYADDVQMNRLKGYDYVKKDSWTKNEKLWEWDAEGFCISRGQRLMARRAELFFRDVAKRDQFRSKKKSDADEAAARIAARTGFAITGDDGQALRRRRA